MPIDHAPIRSLYLCSNNNKFVQQSQAIRSPLNSLRKSLALRDLLHGFGVEQTAVDKATVEQDVFGKAVERGLKSVFDLYGKPLLAFV